MRPLIPIDIVGNRARIYGIITQGGGIPVAGNFGLEKGTKGAGHDPCARSRFDDSEKVQ